jgi:ubiquinone/menaquinone biosynthesis C-methylase UbiE
MENKFQHLEFLREPEPFGPMTNFENNRLWENENIFTYYEQGRKFTRPLNKQIVQETLSKYITTQDGSIIEVGAGTGEMSILFPEELKNRVIQLEKSRLFTEINRVHNPDAPLVNSDIYNLPFHDKSADVVTGFSMFDTLHEAEKAAAEIKRVLKKGGEFIHFLDLEHNDDTLFNDFAKEGKIIFSGLFNNTAVVNPDQDPGEYSYCYASRSEIENVIEKVKDTESRTAMERYLQNPFQEYMKMRDISGFDKINKAILDLNRLGVVFPAFNPTEYFQTKMQKVFSASGFNILQNGTQSKHEFINRDDDRIKDISEKSNYIRNKVGRLIISSRGKNIPADMVKLESVLHVFVAQKE